MYAHKYKQFYITHYFDRKKCSVIFPKGGLVGYFKSYRSAQLFITKQRLTDEG